MSKLYSFDDFIKNKIEYTDDISDIENVLPDTKKVTYTSSGKTLLFNDYYKVNSVTYPNFKKTNNVNK